MQPAEHTAFTHDSISSPIKRIGREVPQAAEGRFVEPSSNGWTVPLKSLKKGVGSGSISQRYGSAYPNQHQNVTESQHWFKHSYFR